MTRPTKEAPRRRLVTERERDELYAGLFAAIEINQPEACNVVRVSTIRKQTEFVLSWLASRRVTRKRGAR